MELTHIVFDIDGTLLDTESAVLLSLRDIIEEEHNDHTVDINSLRFALGIPGNDALIKLGFNDLEYYNNLWMEKFQKYYKLIHVFNGIESTLEKLKKEGLSLGIITSKTKKEYQTDFVPFGLADYFDTIICSEDSLKHKPFSEPMEKFLEYSNSAADEALYIGDTLYDLQCAKGTNVKFALALWGCKDSHGIQADYFLSEPNDIFNNFS